MKITEVAALSLSRPHEPERQWATAAYRTTKADCSIVVVQTDEGLMGSGEACAYGVPPAIADWVAWLRPLLVGRDPRDPAIALHPNGRGAAGAAGHAHDCAVAGLDAALWDLKGKLAGRRVCDLLAPHAPARVRLYASGGVRYDWGARPESLIEEVLGYLDAGYTACKVRIGTEWAWHGVDVDRFSGLMRELAGAVGGRMELMLDGNQRLTEEQALAVGRVLDGLGFTWFEEPIPQADVDGYARLNAALGLPITGGEQFTTVEQFRPYLERRAYGIVQPDAGWCGIGEALRIGQLAAHYGVDLCPHNWHNGLMTMANAHLVAALPHPRVLELPMSQGPLQWAILRERPPIAGGWLELPDRPGLGVDLAPDLAERFPYVEGPYGVTVQR